MKKSTNEFLRSDAVAALAGCTPSYVRRLIRDGRIAVAVWIVDATGHRTAGVARDEAKRFAGSVKKDD